MKKLKKSFKKIVVEDAYVRDVSTNFGGVRTSEECAAKKTNLQFFEKTLFMHYFGLNFSFLMRALQKSEFLQNLQKHPAYKHLPSQKKIGIF